MMNVTFDSYYEDVFAMLKAAVNAVDPTTAVKRHLRRDGRLLKIGDRSVNLDRGRLFVLSVGKAALPMAQAAVDIVGEDVATGIVVAKTGSVPIGTTLPRFTLFEAGHPVSDVRSVQATTAVHNLAEMATADDVVLCLVSGGASALLTEPILPLPVWQALLRALLASGCSIQEFNRVRRQLDRIKGGGLAWMVAPAACHTLILSDVVGNELASIGSGPTVLADELQHVDEVAAILQRYGIQQRVETAVWAQVERALSEAEPLSIWQRPTVHHHIIGDVAIAAQAALTAAAQRGFLTQVMTTHLEGEAREVGRFVGAIAKDLTPKRCLIFGGETTVTLRGNGEGGRNQEVALAAALAIAGTSHVVVASVATDGDDHTTGMAGAVVTGMTVPNGRLHNLDASAALQNNDSYTYFRQLDSLMASSSHLIHTGPTGTNVNDLIIILTYPHS